MEVFGIRGCIGKVHVLRADRSRGIERHADLVVVQAEDAVQDFDLPPGSALDLLAQVEGRVRRVQANGDVNQSLAVARHVAPSSPHDSFMALSASRTATKIRWMTLRSIGVIDLDQNLSGCK